MSDLIKEKILIVLALLLCVAVSLLGVWDSPDVLPMGVIYAETAISTVNTTASDHTADTTFSNKSSGVDDKNQTTAGNAERHMTNTAATLYPTSKESFVRTTGNRGDSSGKININEASVEELMRLDGIGEVLAKRILEYRMAHGNFISVEEILNIDGIGEKRFAAIRDAITV